jgi:hypothetical protein
MVFVVKRDDGTVEGTTSKGKRGKKILMLQS